MVVWLDVLFMLLDLSCKIFVFTSYVSFSTCSINILGV